MTRRKYAADLAANRRDFLKAAAAGLASAGALTVSVEGRAQTKTSARIVIAGAGAAGLATAARLSARLDGAQITIIDARKRHLYQPGFTLIAAGLHDAAYSVSSTQEWVPRNVRWIEAGVAEFDPDANRVVTDKGETVDYDFLVVATGLKLDYDSIEGMEVDRIGQDGLGSVYASPEAAEATAGAMRAFVETGGSGVFLRPATEMKCAGAPLKYAFITDDVARREGTRSKLELTYAAHNSGFFSVPIVNEKVRMLFEDRGFATVRNHVMTDIDLGRKVAGFATPEGRKELGYDFINVIPPMRAPDAVRNSPLAWGSGKWAADGWVEADQQTLRHPRYANIFAVGDVAGVPKGKTAASAKWQVPVAVDHLVADIAGEKSDSVYNGYTSCPLITRIGRAMLIEFDYRNNLTPSFPGVIAPLEELWVTWIVKAIALKPTYYAMVRGEA